MLLTVFGLDEQSTLPHPHPQSLLAMLISPTPSRDLGSLASRIRARLLQVDMWRQEKAVFSSAHNYCVVLESLTDWSLKIRGCIMQWMQLLPSYFALLLDRSRKPPPPRRPDGKDAGA